MQSGHVKLVSGAFWMSFYISFGIRFWALLWLYYYIWNLINWFVFRTNGSHHLCVKISRLSACGSHNVNPFNPIVLWKNRKRKETVSSEQVNMSTATIRKPRNRIITQLIKRPRLATEKKLLITSNENKPFSELPSLVQTNTILHTLHFKGRKCQQKVILPLRIEEISSNKTLEFVNISLGAYPETFRVQWQ